MTLSQKEHSALLQLWPNSLARAALPSSVVEVNMLAFNDCNRRYMLAYIYMLGWNIECNSWSQLSSIFPIIHLSNSAYALDFQIPWQLLRRLVWPTRCLTSPPVRTVCTSTAFYSLFVFLCTPLNLFLLFNFHFFSFFN